MKIIAQLMLLSLFVAQVCWGALRDPTRPEFVENAFNIPIQNLKLTGVIVSSNRTLAIINNNFIRLGDTLSGYKVVSIQLNAVQLDGPGGRITLNLLNQVVKDGQAANN